MSPDHLNACGVLNIKYLLDQCIIVTLSPPQLPFFWVAKPLPTVTGRLSHFWTVQTFRPVAVPAIYLCPLLELSVFLV